MNSVEKVLADIRAIATDEHDKGDRFERLSGLNTNLTMCREP